MERFSKEALRKADGKTVPLTMGSEGQTLVIGEATLHFVEDRGLVATISIDDELVSTWFKENPLP